MNNLIDITGVLQGPDGKPISGAKITLKASLTTYGIVESSEVSTVTDEDGKYSMPCGYGRFLATITKNKRQLDRGFVVISEFTPLTISINELLLAFRDGGVEVTWGVEEAPANNILYGRRNRQWYPITAAGVEWGLIHGNINDQVDLMEKFATKLEDAPVDTFLYGRKDGQWEKIVLDDGTYEWGSIIGDITSQTDLMDEFAKYLPLDGQAKDSRRVGGFLASVDNENQHVVARTSNGEIAVTAVRSEQDTATLPENADYFVVQKELGAGGDNLQRLLSKSEILALIGGIDDAPANENIYGRKGGAWEVIPEIISPEWGSITGDIANQTDLQTALSVKLEDAASDGKIYGRQDGSWVEVVGGGGGDAVWGSITGTITDQSDLMSQFALKVDLAPTTTNRWYAMFEGEWQNLNPVLKINSLEPAIGDGNLNLVASDVFAAEQSPDDDAVYVRQSRNWVELQIPQTNWGDIQGDLSNQTDLQNKFNLYSLKTDLNDYVKLNAGSIQTLSRELWINHDGSEFRAAADSGKKIKHRLNSWDFYTDVQQGQQDQMAFYYRHSDNSAIMAGIGAKVSHNVVGEIAIGFGASPFTSERVIFNKNGIRSFLIPQGSQSDALTRKDYVDNAVQSVSVNQIGDIVKTANLVSKRKKYSIWTQDYKGLSAKMYPGLWEASADSPILKRVISDNTACTAARVSETPFPHLANDGIHWIAQHANSVVVQVNLDSHYHVSTDAGVTYKEVPLAVANTPGTPSQMGFMGDHGPEERIIFLESYDASGANAWYLDVDAGTWHSFKFTGTGLEGDHHIIQSGFALAPYGNSADYFMCTRNSGGGIDMWKFTKPSTWGEDGTVVKLNHIADLNGGGTGKGYGFGAGWGFFQGNGKVGFVKGDGTTVTPIVNDLPDNKAYTAAIAENNGTAYWVGFSHSTGKIWSVDLSTLTEGQAITFVERGDTGITLGSSDYFMYHVDFNANLFLSKASINNHYETQIIMIRPFQSWRFDVFNSPVMCERTWTYKAGATTSHMVDITTKQPDGKYYIVYKGEYGDNTFDIEGLVVGTNEYLLGDKV